MGSSSKSESDDPLRKITKVRKVDCFVLDSIDLWAALGKVKVMLWRKITNVRKVDCFVLDSIDLWAVSHPAHWQLPLLPITFNSDCVRNSNNCLLYIQYKHLDLAFQKYSSEKQSFTEKRDLNIYTCVL